MDTPEQTLARCKALAAQAAKVFRPRSPITTKELFAGRWNELTSIADAVSQPGLHVVIYGERGVGKTSLANVVSPTIWAIDNHGKDPGEVTERLVIKSVANGGDTFSTIWNRLFSEFAWPGAAAGMADQQKQISTREFFALGETLGIDDVRRVLSQMPGAVFIIDEFDRAKRETSKDFTDLIKTLSDLGIDCTVILVGVSETVGNLVTDHASINRAIVQIRLERMKTKELLVILQNAERALQIKFAQDAANLIVHVSQGLPHYTHLIGLHAVRALTERVESDEVRRDDVLSALKRAVKLAEQTVTEEYSTATHSAHRDALYRHVLLACALTAASSHDALGYFNPSSVVQPLEEILRKTVTIATFTNHLGEFCQDKRGSVLERDGQPWGYRYRFRDPLLVPFVFMNAVEGHLLSDVDLVRMLG